MDSPPERADVAVVGGGILGLAVARELIGRDPGRTVAVLERGPAIATGQTGRNSGVVHAGLSYAPGSLKARLCVEGAAALAALCEERGLPFARCGKVVVAAGTAELARLDELERRGRANGVPGLRRLDPAGLEAVEPHARGLAALHSPATAICDFAAVARALAGDVRAAGGTVSTGCAAARIEEVGRGVRVHHARGVLAAGRAVACAGGGADRLAEASGGDPDPRIVPFRGAYLRLRPARAHLVRALIYPVPDPALPFLGVHLTRRTAGDVLLGPTALLAAHGLRRTLAWPGTRRLARRHWRAGLLELRHAASRRALAAAAARLVPELVPGDLEPAFAGTRAQALARGGSLLNDFAFSGTARALHVRNAPSPAATSSLAIARHVADLLTEVSPAPWLH